MCKFHQDVAVAIATDPVTKVFDARLYAVALVATARHRIEQYMPGQHDLDGNNRYEMASTAGQRAYVASPLKDRTDTGPFAADDIAALRATLLDVVARHDLSALPKRPAAFLDEASTALYEGYALSGYAPQVLSLKAQAHKPAFEPLRAATADFLAQPGVTDKLHALFAHSVVRIFNDAKQSVSPALLKAYDSLPGGLRKSFRSCAMCARDGVGGAAVSHVGCIVIPTVAAMTGTAVSGTFLAATMMITAPLIAIGATWGLDRLRGQKSSPLKLVGSAGIAVAMALAISSLTGGHDHHAGHNMDGHTMPGHDHRQMMEGQHGHHTGAVIPMSGDICGPGRKNAPNPAI